MGPENRRSPEFIRSGLLSIIESGFNHPGFPKELKPKEDLNRVTRIISEDEFNNRIVPQQLEHIHPILKENPQLLRKFLIPLRAAPALNDYFEGKIYLRAKKLAQLLPEEILLTVGHEIGHFITKEKESPIKWDHQRDSINELLGAKRSEVKPDSKFSVYTRGFSEYYLLDGLIIGGSGGFKVYDEFYADAYSLFLYSNVQARKLNTSFTEALNSLLKCYETPSKEDLGSGSERVAAYHSALIRFTGEMGWENFLLTGTNSDIATFLKLSGSTFGDKTVKKLDELAGYFITSHRSVF